MFLIPSLLVFFSPMRIDQLTFIMPKVFSSTAALSQLAVSCWMTSLRCVQVMKHGQRKTMQQSAFHLCYCSTLMFACCVASVSLL